MFNDEGVCLRRIGGEYITSFPNGIDISENGEILVGDSHGNRFHVAVFSHNGTHLTDLECPYIKVSLKLFNINYIYLFCFKFNPLTLRRVNS